MLHDEVVSSRKRWLPPPRLFSVAGLLLLSVVVTCCICLALQTEFLNWPASEADELSTDTIPKHDTFMIGSKILREDRRINVFVPDIDHSQSGELPVLYMLDGGLQEDFPHIAVTLETLIVQREIAPAILVGIENTERRRDLTGPTTVEEDRTIAPRVGESEAFRSFIRTELIPEIHSRYRCSEESAIVGESLAGLFVVETMLLDPAMFDRYIAMDPSLWWNDHRLVRDAGDHLEKLRDQNVVFWFTASDATDIRLHTDQLEKVLQESGHLNLKWTYDPRPEEEHNTIFKATKADAFRAALWKLKK